MTSKVKEYDGEEAQVLFGRLLAFMGETFADTQVLLKEVVLVETKHDGGDDITWVFSYTDPDGYHVILNLARKVTSSTGVKQ